MKEKNARANFNKILTNDTLTSILPIFFKDESGDTCKFGVTQDYLLFRKSIPQLTIYLN